MADQIQGVTPTAAGVEAANQPTTQSAAPVQEQGSQNQPPSKPTDRLSLIKSWMQAGGGGAEPGKQSEQQQQEPASSGQEANESPSEPAPGGDDGSDLSQVAQDTGTTPESPEPQQQEEKPEGDQAESDKHRWPQDAVERVKKLKLQRNKARDEVANKDRALDEMAQRLSDMERTLRSTQPRQPDPIETLPDVDAVKARAAEAMGVAEWAIDRLDVAGDNPESVGAELEKAGFKAPEDGWDQKSVKEQLRVLRDNARTVINLGAQRKAWLESEQRNLSEMLDRVPELAEADGVLAQEVQDVLSRYPGLKREPNWAELAIAGVLGMRQLAARNGARVAPKVPAPKPAAAVPRAPAVPTVAKASVPAPNQARILEQLRLKATSKGATKEDRVAFIKAQMAGQNQT